MNAFSANLARLLIAYAVEGLAVAVAAYYLGNKKVSVKQVVLIGLTAATAHLVLDAMAPAVGAAARQGEGLGIGLQRVGMFEPFDVPKKHKKSEGFKTADEPEEAEEEEYGDEDFFANESFTAHHADADKKEKHTLEHFGF